MTLPKNGKLLRIFIGESDKHEGLPLYEWIVRQARENGLAGATVLRGLEGYGAHSRLHKAKILRLASDLPLGTKGYFKAFKDFRFFNNLAVPDHQSWPF